MDELSKYNHIQGYILSKKKSYPPLPIQIDVSFPIAPHVVHVGTVQIVGKYVYFSSDFAIILLPIDFFSLPPPPFSVFLLFSLIF